MSRRVPKVVRIQPWDAEVAAKMKQIHRTEIPGHRHQRQASRRLSQNHRALHVHAVEHKPNIRGSVVNGAAVFRGGDYVLPSPQMVCRPDSLDGALIGNPAVTEAHRMDAHSVKLVDRLPRGRVRVRQHPRGYAEQGSVESEV